MRVLCLLAMMLLAGCGQKGPLYMAPREPAQAAPPLRSMARRSCGTGSVGGRGGGVRAAAMSKFFNSNVSISRAGIPAVTLLGSLVVTQ